MRKIIIAKTSDIANYYQQELNRLTDKRDLQNLHAMVVKAMRDSYGTERSDLQKVKDAVSTKINVRLPMGW